MFKKIAFIISLIIFFLFIPSSALAETVSSTITVGNNDSSLTGNSFNRTSVTQQLGKSGASSVQSLLLFSNITVPKNAVITNAYVDFGLAGSGGNTINVKIAAQNSSSPTAPTNVSTFKSVASNITTQNVTWNNVPHGAWGDIITTPNIASVVQALVNRTDWQSGNSMQLWVGDNGSASYSGDDFFTANFGGGGQKPRLTIVYSTGVTPTATPTFTPTPLPTISPTPTLSPTNTPNSTPTNSPTPAPTRTPTPPPSATPTVTPTPSPTLTPSPIQTPTPTPPSGTPVTITNSVTQSGNDSELVGSSFSSTGVTIVLGKDGNISSNSFNLFSNLNVPSDVTITNATISYELAGSGGNTVNARIAAEATGSATAPTTASQFSTKQTNLTTAKVDWNAVPKGSWGTKITSPNISSVIQEIVNRPDWQSGNSIQIWAGDNGSGAYSGVDYFSADFSGAGQKPTLTITYVMSGQTPTPSVSPSPSLTPTPTASPSASPTSTPSPTPVPGTTIVTVPVNYAQTEGLYYKQLTLIAQIGTVSGAIVYANGDQIPSSYNASTGELMFTTSATQIDMHLVNVTDPNTVTIKKAPLKDNKKWAWSMSFDDNVNIKASVNVMQSLGYRGTFYLIGNVVDPVRDESWIVDKPYLVQKLNQGWSVGNHTWDHDCDTPNVNTVLQGYAVERDIVDSSQVTGYKVTSFAAPCYSAGYYNIIDSMRANNQTEVKFNESQGSGLMIINPGAASYTAGGNTADATSSTTTSIGRDAEIDWAPQNVKNRMAWMSSNATSNRNFWLNTYLHGDREANLSNVANYAYSNFGAGGTNEMWMAPADEVYSYLMVRDNASIGPLQIH